MSGSFWDTIDTIASAQEADVETWLVLPLLEALGHHRSCVASKMPVLFREGRNLRRGRKPEADFVVYAEAPFTRATCLIVVEAKRPGEPLDNDGQEQGESYAQNLRAPMLLMTNGQRLEIWQIQLTTDSARVFECDVGDLASHRGALEQLLSKDAIKDHCRTIDYKRFDVLAGDLGAYERAELDRITSTAQSAIARTLMDRATTQTVVWSETLAMRGVLIVGSSGYGKTVLAASLLKEGFERRIEGTAEAIPFDLFLPDLALGEQALEDFLADRVAAHKPGYSSAALRWNAREQGLLIIADGYERVAPDRRANIDRLLRTMMRDYPKAQLILLSRANVAPGDLGLHTLQLEGYSPQDLRELAQARASTYPNVVHAFTGAPAHIYRVGEVALLADRLLVYYERNHKHPSQLAPLYETWLASILERLQPVEQAIARALLETLARETATEPVAITRALELAGDGAEAKNVLERLAEADAILIRGVTVELQHEALADYMRAVQFWRQAPDSRTEALALLAFDSAAQFAVLLVNTAPDRDWRGRAWLRIAQADLKLAIRSLRFAAGNENFSAPSSDDQARQFLADIRETIETLLASHFDTIADDLRAKIAGMPVALLGITGGVNAEAASYSFFDASQTTEPVRLGRQDEDACFYGHSLRHYGYGPEAGRILGVTRLKEALDELLKERNLKGGAVWIAERTFGRLRHLAKRYGAPESTLNLQDAHDILMRQADAWVVGDAFSAAQTFSVQELLDDIRSLIAQGILQLDPWWEDPRNLDLHSDDGQQRFARTLDEYYRRLQLAYTEIVDHSFPLLRPHLRTLRMMPLRMEIEVQFHTRRGFEDIALNYRRWPVATYRQAGADVSFPDVLTDYYSRDSGRAYIERTDALLASFGRSFVERYVRSGGTRVPDFEGYDTSFDRLPDESAVARAAAEWLKSDLDDLFNEAPRY